MQEVRDFQDGGADDDGGGDQKGKVRGPFVVEAAEQTTDDGNARAGNAGQQGPALPNADGGRIGDCHFRQWFGGGVGGAGGEKVGGEDGGLNEFTATVEGYDVGIEGGHR